MLFFNSRSAARSFKAKKDSFKLVDLGVDAKHRWAVKVK